MTRRAAEPLPAAVPRRALGPRAGALLASMLVAGLFACAPQPAPEAAASPAASPVALRVAGTTVAYTPPAGWTPGHAYAGHGWHGPDGRLVVISHGGDRGHVGRDPVARVKWLLADRARQSSGGARQVRLLEPTRLDGRPAAKAITRDRYDKVESSLYVVVGDELLGLTLVGNSVNAPAAAARLDVLAASVDLDSRLAPEAQPTLPVVATEPGRRHHRRHRREGTPRDEGWDQAMAIGLASLVFLLFTAFPAYLGAATGWDLAVTMRQDPRRGAAWGAYQATGVGIFVATVIVVGLLGAIFGQARGGAGIMSGAMAGFLVIIVVVAFAACAGGIGGFFAAFGAALGGKRGRGAACKWAAVAAAVGVLLTPWILKLMVALVGDDTHRHRRRHSALPPPVVAVLAAGARDPGTLPGRGLDKPAARPA